MKQVVLQNESEIVQKTAPENLKAYLFYSIDLLAIQQKSLDRALFYTLLYERLDRVALELQSLLCTFENSTKCSEVSFD